jgi:hypothetical protein
MTPSRFCFLYSAAAARIWQSLFSPVVVLTGQYAVTDGVKAVAGHRPQRSMPDQPAGVAWQEDELDALFPKLSAKFG